MYMYASKGLRKTKAFIVSYVLGSPLSGMQSVSKRRVIAVLRK